MGDGEHAEAGLLGGRLDAAGAGPQGVDVEAGVELVEHGERRAQHAELQGLVALLLAAGQVDVHGPVEEPVVEADALGLGDDQRRARRRCRARWRAKAASSTSTSGHAGHLGGVLHGEEQAGLGPLPRRHGEHVDPVEGDRAAEHLVAGPAHDDVRQRGLAGAVRAHDGVDLARADGEVDPLEDLLAGHAGPQALDLQHVISHRRPPRSARRRRGPRTRARPWWRAATRARRRPARTRCRASSTRWSRSSQSTSPSASEMSWWVQRSPMA